MMPFNQYYRHTGIVNNILINKVLPTTTDCHPELQKISFGRWCKCSEQSKLNGE